ncbi:MAG: hypothetical protein AAFV28_15270, partial [Cyanobacteria bacterium J06635_13]
KNIVAISITSISPEIVCFLTINNQAFIDCQFTESQTDRTANKIAVEGDVCTEIGDRDLLP